jgi:hypothetical protein
VDILEMLDTFDREVIASPMGQLNTVQATRLVGAGFGDGTVLDSNFWGSTAVGTGTIITGGNQVTLSTGAVVASSGTLRSSRSGRYVGANANYYRSNLRIPSTTGANRRRWGAYTATDGYFFEFNGTTLSLVCRKSGSDSNRVASGSFNGDAGSTYTLSSTATTYEICWTNKNVWFSINNQIIHKFSGDTAPLTNTSTLPVAAENANAAGNTNVNTFEVRSSTINRLGPLQTESQYKYVNATGTNICKYGAGRLNRVVISAPDAAAQNIRITDSIGNASPIITEIIIPNAANALQPNSIEYQVPFSTGLTVITDTANGITVIYE